MDTLPDKVYIPGDKKCHLGTLGFTFSCDSAIVRKNINPITFSMPLAETLTPDSTV